STLPLHSSLLFFLLLRRPPPPPLFPYTTLFRSRSPFLPPTPRHWGRRSRTGQSRLCVWRCRERCRAGRSGSRSRIVSAGRSMCRSEEHTSELQSRSDLVCRLLLEKKNRNKCAHA